MSGDWPLYSGPPEHGRSYLKVDPSQLRPGVRFDTEFEIGCAVTGPVDGNGTFEGRDSEGVECQFTVLMVVRIED